MKNSIKRSRPNYYLLLIGVVCLILAGVLSYRYVHRIQHRPRPIPREVNVSLVQGWMTIPYLSRTYGVPESELFLRLNIDPKKDRNFSLERVAERSGKSQQAVIEEVQNAIREFQTAHPPPLPPKSP